MNEYCLNDRIEILSHILLGRWIKFFSSETSVSTYHTTRCHWSEDSLPWIARNSTYYICFQGGMWGSYGSEYKTAEPSRNIQTLQRNRLSNHQDGWVKSPTLMMETESSSVTSEHFYWQVNLYVPECVNSYPYSGPGMKDIKHQSALQNSTTLHTPVAQREREILPHSLPFEGLMRGICSRGNVT